jgi:hypothetical protein
MTLLTAFYVKCALIGFAGAAALACLLAAASEVMGASGF